MIETARRYGFLLFGWLCVGIGLVGVVLPGLPTTVFMLMALWAFSKSSERFRVWLYEHKRFGPPLQAWQRHGVIAPRAKMMALSLMAVSVITMLAFSNFHWAGLAALVAVITGAAVFVASRPGFPPRQPSP